MERQTTRAMRTLVVSDLHLGGRSGVDVLRRDAALDALTAALAGVDRLVLLGATLALRHGPAREALAAARPALEAIGSALDAQSEIVVVAGNHDHALVAPWLDGATRRLGLERCVRPATASRLAREVAGWLGAQRTTVAYPGVWLRDGVYATHGHYLDPHGTVPTFERLAAGVMQRLGAALPDGTCTAEDYERVLAPLYAWIHSAAQRAPEGRRAAGAGRAGKAYELLTGDGHQPVRLRVLAAVFPLGIRGLNLAGIGPLEADLSGPALRRSSLVGIGEALARLGVEADDVIFGHSHRAGPLAADAAEEWRTPAGARLHNSGNWVYETHFLSGAGPESPYWPGAAVLVEDSGPPRVERLLAGVGADALRPPRA